jgi:hypothetical protein
MLSTNLHCPGCGRYIDQNSATLGIPISLRQEGDTAVCLHCGTIYIYGLGVVLLPATQKQLQALSDNERELLAHTSAAVHSLRRRPDDLSAIAQALEDIVRKARAIHVELPTVERAAEVLRNQIERDLDCHLRCHS